MERTEEANNAPVNIAKRMDVAAHPTKLKNT
jgi:hypothetical protein